MSDVTPARVGLLIDYVDDDGGFDENILPSLQLVADEFVEQGVLERPVEFVVRAVQGLPNGTFRAVRDAFFELVEQDSLVIFGPWVSENGAALRRYVEELAEVACITMAATETMLGEWVFGLPAGSMEEEPIIMATVAALDGCRTVGIAFEDSLIGAEYLRTTRVACNDAGLRITAEVPIPQVQVRKANGDGDARCRQARRHPARRVRSRHPRRERRTAGDRLDATAVHHHRLRVRIDRASGGANNSPGGSGSTSTTSAT